MQRTYTITGDINMRIRYHRKFFNSDKQFGRDEVLWLLRETSRPPVERIAELDAKYADDVKWRHYRDYWLRRYMFKDDQLRWSGWIETGQTPEAVKL